MAANSGLPKTVSRSGNRLEKVTGLPRKRSRISTSSCLASTHRSKGRNSNCSGLRARSSIVPTIAVMDATVRCILTTIGSSLSSPLKRLSKISTPPCNTVSGVRNSWLTSPVNSCSRFKNSRKACSLPANARASSPTSSSREHNRVSSSASPRLTLPVSSTSGETSRRLNQ